MGSIFVRIIEMSPAIKGYAAPDGNGDYNIYINECLSDTEKLRTYVHEMRHIKGRHFDHAVTLALAEMEADGGF